MMYFIVEEVVLMFLLMFMGEFVLVNGCLKVFEMFGFGVEFLDVIEKYCLYIY